MFRMTENQFEEKPVKQTQSRYVTLGSTSNSEFSIVLNFHGKMSETMCLNYSTLKIRWS